MRVGNGSAYQHFCVAFSYVVLLNQGRIPL